MEQSPLHTRDALYGGRTEAMRLHYKVQGNETLHYIDVMSLYPYICEYFKFPICHPVIHVGEACKNKGSLFAYGRSDKIFVRAAGEAVSPGPPC